MHIFSQRFRGNPDGWLKVGDACFLVGENSTGKSSFGSLVQLLWSKEFMLGNTINFVLPSLGEFSDFYSKLSKGKGNAENSFTIGLSVSDGEDNAYAKIITFEEDAGRIEIRRLTVFDGKTMRKMSYRDKKIFKVKRGVAGSKNSPENFVKKLEQFHFGKLEDEHEVKSLSGERHPPPVWQFLILYDGQELASGDSITVPEFSVPQLSSFHAFGPIRSKPERVYFSEESTFDPGGRSVINSLPKSLKKGAFKNSLVSFGKSSGLFEDILAEDISSKLGKKAIIVKFIKGKKEFFADELGYGVSQIMPLIIDASLKTKSLLLIQQPELHLHPRAQSAFGDVLFTYVQNGGRIIIETHSDFIIDRFRVRVAEARTNKPFSQVLYFYSYRGENKCTSIEIDGDGRLKNPPASYRKFFLREELRKFHAI